MLSNELFYYSCSILVDVTPTKVYHTNNSQDRDLARNQQRNWDTVLQTLGLRCQIFDINEPQVKTCNIDNFYFGRDFEGEHRVWTFSFAVDRPDIFQSNSYDPTGALFLDFDKVPIIIGLTETAKFRLPVIRSHGTQKNITFTKLKNGK